ncbi:hypothetical protein FEM48_Zijuj05G0147400 [Ziziphus jujuba var. spinosa]|uniref:Glutathione S-transferase n=1 Tax=Ziziphus jujuba var. spinosa TaxID=714518 RepID=A0A978VFF3_ZIZJJ|nr:hypothetical protein FEM48_Zijuj05G0147400 [Ziziphus jujuba var. spinosa]
MTEENKVTLHGVWASPFSKRLEIGLKLKAVAFKYVQEDLMDKSLSLLEYPVVYKNVLLLVHNGKPILQVFESMSLVSSSDKETREKASKELFEKLKVFEEGMKEIFPDGIPCVDSNSVCVGILDVLLPTERPVAKEKTPPHHKLVAVLHTFRNAALKSSATLP